MTTPAQEAMLVEVGSLFTELAAWAKTAIRPDDHRFCAEFAAAHILDVLDSNNIQAQALVGKPAGDGPILIGVELAPLRWVTWSRAEPGGGWGMETLAARNQERLDAYLQKTMGQAYSFVEHAPLGKTTGIRLSHHLAKQQKHELILPDDFPPQRIKSLQSACQAWRMEMIVALNGQSSTRRRL